METWTRSYDGKPQSWRITYRCLDLACHIVEVSFICGIELGLVPMKCPACGQNMEMQEKTVLKVEENKW